MPFGDWGIRIVDGLTTLWVGLGSWVAVFPGTLEKLFGFGYDLHDERAYHVLSLGQSSFDTLR